MYFRIIIFLSLRYGGPAGQVASNTLDTVGNVITIGHHSRFFTPKGIVKVAAKQTGKAVTQHRLHGESSRSGLYPSLSSIQQSDN